MAFSNFSFTSLEKLIARPDLPVDERRTRAFLMLFLLAVLPVLCAFTFWHALTRGITHFFFLLGITIAVDVGTMFVLRHARSTRLFYRSGGLIMLSLLVYLLAIGESYGVAYIWFFFHPVAAFYLFGIREGLFWVLVSWVICLFITVFNVGPYPYLPAIGIRFMVSYTLVAILAYGLEAARQYYYDQLAVEKMALEAALQQVKTLQELLPICASCKKIRDDQGYWHQVETYIRHHAGVEFSHGICPDCLAELYPEFQRKKVNES